MNREGFSREAVKAPELNHKPEVVPNPDAIERVPKPKPPTWVWMIILVVGMVALMVMLYRTGNRTLYMGSFVLLPMMLFMLFRGRGGGGNRNNSRAAVNDRRATYLRDLDKLRDLLHRRGREQAQEIAYHHPNAGDGSLLTLVGSARMWSRRPDSPNFGHVRFGVGLTQVKTVLVPPDKVPPPHCQEPVTTIAARDFLLSQNVVHDVPRPLHLFDQRGWAWFADAGQRPVLQGLLRALVCQACVFHGPDDLRVVIVTDDPPVWEWAKWLPHTADREVLDASGDARLIFTDLGAFLQRFGSELAGRGAWVPPVEGGADPHDWLLVVVDYPDASCGPILGDSGYAGVSVLEATGDEGSVLATRATAYQIDEYGTVLKAEEGNDG